MKYTKVEEVLATDLYESTRITHPRTPGIEMPTQAKTVMTPSDSYASLRDCESLSSLQFDPPPSQAESEFSD